jgi:hypothetical protein
MILPSIGTKYPNERPAKANGNSHLYLNPKPSLAKRDPHSLTVNRFKKSKSKLVINLIKHPNNPFGQRIIHPRKFNLPITRNLHQAPNQFFSLRLYQLLSVVPSSAFVSLCLIGLCFYQSFAFISLYPSDHRYAFPR